MLLKYMNQIFDALNPQNQNDVFDCCNGNLKCKEKEFSKKCVSGASGSTYGFEAPVLSCDVSVADRAVIYATGIQLTNYVNTETATMLAAINTSNFETLAATVPTNVQFQIANIKTEEVVFKSSDTLPDLTYRQMINYSAGSLLTEGTMIFCDYQSYSNTQAQLKTMAKNIKQNKIVKMSSITPHAINYTTSVTTLGKITAQTTTPTASGEVVSSSVFIFTLESFA